MHKPDRGFITAPPVDFRTLERGGALQNILPGMNGWVLDNPPSTAQAWPLT